MHQHKQASNISLWDGDKSSFQNCIIFNDFATILKAGWIATICLIAGQIATIKKRVTAVLNNSDSKAIDNDVVVLWTKTLFE